jgi:ArsR family transcriptional regulator, arsenate/arsenite/antimonite-responsive transcriptional repressor
MSSLNDQLPVDTFCCAPLTAGRLDERKAVELAGLLQALADPVRLRLISIIASAPTGEVCACDLPTLLERSQPTVSHHLSQLVRAGLLEREQRGKWAWFRLRPERLVAVRTALGEGAGTTDSAGQAGTASQPGPD